MVRTTTMAGISNAGVAARRGRFGILMGGLALAVVFACGAAAAQGELRTGIGGAGGAPSAALEAGYGFGVAIPRPFVAPGAQLDIDLVLFNRSATDAFGSPELFGDRICLRISLREGAGGQVVYRETGCPLAADPEPPGLLRAGGVLATRRSLPMLHRLSETGDPDGEPLPGGLYTLEVEQRFGGPIPEGWPAGAGGGSASSEVPFRVVHCTAGGDLFESRMVLAGEIDLPVARPEGLERSFVIRTEGAAKRFWKRHAAQLVPKPVVAPEVDYGEEMVVVVLLDPRSIAFWFQAEVLLEEGECVVQATADFPLFELEPFRSQELPGGIVSVPFQAFAVSRSLKEVVFEGP